MSFENMTPHEREAADPTGARTPGHLLTHGQITAKQRQDQLHRPSSRAPVASSGVAWTLTMLILPYFCLIAVAFYWVMVSAEFASPFRAILMTILPDSWFYTSPESEPEPMSAAIAVGIVLAGSIVGLLVLRRVLGNLWAGGYTGRVMLWLQAFPISVLIVLILATGPAWFFLAGAVASTDVLPPPGSGETLRSWPLTLTGLTALWWSIGTTRRSVRRAHRQRFKGWWQADDGEWYPPQVPKVQYGP